MSEGFTKLFRSLIHSTVWRESNHVRCVWITMLAMVNRNGIVEASLPGLADAARVTIEECEEALGKFHAPDKYSRSKAHEGRRIETVEGGWRLLNHEDYRRRMSAEDQREKTAKRVRRSRDRDREFAEYVTTDALQTVTETNGIESNDIAEADTESDPEADQDPPSGEKRARGSTPDKPQRRKPKHVLPTDWRPTPEHLERARGLGLNCRVEYEKFRAQAESTGRVLANWNAGFTTWLLRAVDFAPRGGSRGRALAPRQPDSGYSPSAHAKEVT